MNSHRVSTLMLALLTAAAPGATFGGLVAAARAAGCTRATRSSVSRALRRLRALGAVELHAKSVGTSRTSAQRWRPRRRRPQIVRTVKLRVTRVSVTETGRTLLAQRSTTIPFGGKSC